MALTNPNFTASESLGSPELVTFEDTSEGTDNTLTSRTLTLKLANGNWLDENGDESTTIVTIDWDYADTTITLDLLTQSTALTATCNWYENATLKYTKTLSFCFNVYDYLFSLQLLQGQTSNPGIVQDTNYLSNFFAYQVNIFCEENAVEWGSDIYSSQGAMNRNLFLEQNENDFF